MRVEPALDKTDKCCAASAPTPAIESDAPSEYFLRVDISSLLPSLNCQQRTMHLFRQSTKKVFHH